MLKEKVKDLEQWLKVAFQAAKRSCFPFSQLSLDSGSNVTSGLAAWDSFSCFLDGRRQAGSTFYQPGQHDVSH